MELSERKLKILKAVIDDYIATAVPVGSQTIVKRLQLDISSATIRNELADLEEMGYLGHPHTSAGRVPNDLAYRLYVDRLIDVPELEKSDVAFMRSYFNNRMGEVEQVIRSTAKVVSDMTDYTAIALAPQLTQVKIKHFQLVPVSEDQALVVVVTDAGIIKDSIISVPKGIDSDNMYKISSIINRTLIGKSLIETRDAMAMLMISMMEHKKLFEAVMSALENTMDYSGTNDIVLGGAANMLKHPEYNDVGRAKSLLAVLETNEVLHSLMSKASSLEYSVSIGEENELDTMKECSLVTVRYKIGDQSLGSIGVIGPTRMQYSKVLSVLHYVGNSLTEVLTAMTKIRNHQGE